MCLSSFAALLISECIVPLDETIFFIIFCNFLISNKLHSINLQLQDQRCFSLYGVHYKDLDKAFGISDAKCTRLYDLINSNKMIVYLPENQIKNPEKSFLVKDDEDRVIFVFTSNTLIRQKLHEIFIKEKYKTFGRKVTFSKSYFYS